MQHYTDYSSYSEAFIAFSQYAREEGLKIGIDESQQAVLSALHGLWMRMPYFQYALAAIFCTNTEERKIFDLIFHRFWTERGSRQKSKTTYKNQSNLAKQNAGTLAMMGQGKSDARKIHAAKTTSGANSTEALRKTDFNYVTQVDEQILNQLSEQLVREMSLRIRRKFKKGKSEQIDLANTIRSSIQQGGNFFRLHTKERKKEKLRLVILLDVSGSMDKYSFYLLRFIYSLRCHFKHIEAFTFSTKLVRITDHLHPDKLHLSLAMLSQKADHWSSGTKIGKCLQSFNDLYGKRVLNGRTMTIILSDGLDTGEASDLAIQLKRIKMRSKRLVWLNPLKGMKGYLPIQKGMQAALPQLDIFQSAHNLESLLTLENIITHA